MARVPIRRSLLRTNLCKLPHTCHVECDRDGNVRLSRFGPKVAGAGGFINISQNARRLVFAGSFSAGGLKVRIEEGELMVEQGGVRP